MSNSRISTWMAVALVVAILVLSGAHQASAQNLAICRGLSPGTWIDVAFFASNYTAEFPSRGTPDRSLEYRNHVDVVRQHILTTAPFSERRDRFRFHVFNLDDPLTNAGPTDGMVRTVRLPAVSNYPIADAVAMDRLLRTHGCPADVVMVMIRGLRGAGGSEGLGFTADMFARRGITLNGARAMLAGAFDPITNQGWFGLDRRLRVDRVGVGTVVIADAPAIEFAPLAVHEFAHAFASLEDEYESEGPSGPGSVRLTPCPDEPANVAAAPARQKLPFVPCARNVVERLDAEANGPEDAGNFPWPIAAGTPIPSTDMKGVVLAGVNAGTVGVFPGGAYSRPVDRRLGFGVYRSQFDCRMKSPTNVKVGFCAVCTRALRDELNTRLRPGADPAVPTAPPPPASAPQVWVLAGLMGLPGLMLSVKLGRSLKATRH